MNNLAGAYKAKGQLDKAVPLYEQALEMKKAKLGADHPDTLKLMSEVANNYEALGRNAEAIRLREETLAALLNLAAGSAATRPLDVRHCW